MAKHNLKAESSSQLTIRGLPAQVTRRLKQEARQRGWSLNRTAVFMLEKATGASSEPALYNDLDWFFGGWSATEADEFDRTLREMRTVDKEMWP